MKSPQQVFCEGLKAERERREITLASIAASTKVKEILLAGLEENDFSRWPQGSVYRRAFVRHYVTCLGLPAQTTLAEFDRLFPDDSAISLDGGPTNDAADGARLALAADSQARWTDSSTRIAAALIDVGAVLLVASVAARLTPLNPWMGISIVALAYHTLGTLFLGRSLGSWWLARPAAEDGVAAFQRSLPPTEATLVSDLQPSLIAENQEASWSSEPEDSSAGAGRTRDVEWAPTIRASARRACSNLWRAGSALFGFPLRLGGVAATGFRHAWSRVSVRRRARALWHHSLGGLRSLSMGVAVAWRRGTATLATILSTVQRTVAATGRGLQGQLRHARSGVRSASRVRYVARFDVRMLRKLLFPFSVAATALTLVIFLFASGGSDPGPGRTGTTVAPLTAPTRAPQETGMPAAAPATSQPAAMAPPFASVDRTSSTGVGNSSLKPNDLKPASRRAAVRKPSRRGRRTVARRRPSAPAVASQTAADAAQPASAAAQPASDAAQPAADAAQPAAATPGELQSSDLVPSLPVDPATANTAEKPVAPPDDALPLNAVGTSTEPTDEVKAPAKKPAGPPAVRSVRRGKQTTTPRAPR